LLAAPATANEVFEDRVVQAILDNPEVVLLALEKLQQEDEIERQAAQQTQISEYVDQLFKDDPYVQLAEFFDYRCGYCARSAANMQMLDADKQKAINLIELPILGQASEEIAKVSLAVRNIAGEAAYHAFHFAVFEAAGRVSNTESAIRLAATLGHEADAIRVEAASNDVAAELLSNRRLAQSFGIQGTPTFVSRDQIHDSMLTPQDIENIINSSEETSQ
jgi:protein-disulfide isomerase